MAIDKSSLLVYIYQNVFTSIQDIMQDFGVSQPTAYRIARLLREEGWIALDNNIITYMPFVYFPLEKERACTQNSLALATLDIIKDGDVICLAGGSSTMALILPFLVMYKKNITLISNSSLVFRFYMALKKQAFQRDIRLITIGGTIRSSFYSFGGEYADDIIHHFNIDKTFMGAEILNIQEGLFTEVPLPDFIEHCFFEVSRSTYLVAAAEKFSEKKGTPWASWSDFTGLICNIDFTNHPLSQKLQCFSVDTSRWPEYPIPSI